jgi:hypothetical protein
VWRPVHHGFGHVHNSAAMEHACTILGMTLMHELLCLEDWCSLASGLDKRWPGIAVSTCLCTSTPSGSTASGYADGRFGEAAVVLFLRDFLMFCLLEVPYPL